MDNCKSQVDMDYPNVEIKIVPTNTTPFIQPMDRTVIATFKSYNSSNGGKDSKSQPPS